MSHLPIFLNLDKKNIIVIGGGKIATNKVTQLLKFTQNITIVAPIITKELKIIIELNNLKVIKKSYKKSCIKDFDIVVVTTNDLKLQKEIYKESRKYNCLFNCSDIQKYCDFIFPSYIKNDDLIIAISTSGTSPAFTKQLKIYISRLIPENISIFLKEMKSYRKSMPKGKKRMLFLQSKAKNYLNTWKKCE